MDAIKHHLYKEDVAHLEELAEQVQRLAREAADELRRSLDAGSFLPSSYEERGRNLDELQHGYGALLRAISAIKEANPWGDED